MNTCYVDKGSRSIADLVAPGELHIGWTITRINVPHPFRGLGVGGQLLRQIVADADAEMITLYLEPAPSDGLSYSALVEWYTRHGFRMTPSGYMVRPPSPRH